MAHAYSAQNRSQRILEYTDRHYALTCTRQTRKRRRILYEAPVESVTQPEEEDEGKVDKITDAEAADAKATSERTIIFGNQTGWSQTG